MKKRTDEHVYGVDAAEWLARWDRGEIVWSVEMGGLGPGYEQGIQITVAEIIRHILDAGYATNGWGDKKTWVLDRAKIETFSHTCEPITKLRLSGAQWGAALQVALKFCTEGPAEAMTNQQVEDRLIQVCRTFPAG